MKKSFLLLVSLLTYSQSRAELGYVVEPYVGFEKGYLTQKTISEITVQGLNFGSRLGLSYSEIRFGLDYMMSSQTTQQSNQKGDFKPTDYGLFVAHKFEGGISLYGTYFLSSKAKVQSNVNSNDFSGSGYKLGLGWKFSPYIEVAGELVSRNYTKYDQKEMTSPLLGSTAGLSIAIPLL